MIFSVTEAETRPSNAEWESDGSTPEAPPATTADATDDSQSEALPDDRLTEERTQLLGALRRYLEGWTP